MVAEHHPSRSAAIATALDGKPIRCRVVWIKLTRDTLRWEQAYSADGGKTWETNWIMSFTRIAAAP